MDALSRAAALMTAMPPAVQLPRIAQGRTDLKNWRFDDLEGPRHCIISNVLLVGIANRPTIQWLCSCSEPGTMEVHTTPLGRQVLGCAIEVHAALGPGLLESMYQRCLAREFELNSLSFRQQVPLPIAYKGILVGLGYRVDFLVQGELLLELKTVERVLPIHDAQILTYLRLLGLRQGFLINFNSRRLMDGVKSYLNSRTVKE